MRCRGWQLPTAYWESTFTHRNSVFIFLCEISLLVLLACQKNTLNRFGVVGEERKKSLYCLWPYKVSYPLQWRFIFSHGLLCILNLALLIFLWANDLSLEWKQVYFPTLWYVTKIVLFPLGFWLFTLISGGFNFQQIHISELQWMTYMHLIT